MQQITDYLEVELILYYLSFTPTFSSSSQYTNPV